jgi:hypothetical protein
MPRVARLREQQQATAGAAWCSMVRLRQRHDRSPVLCLVRVTGALCLVRMMTALCCAWSSAAACTTSRVHTSTPVYLLHHLGCFLARSNFGLHSSGRPPTRQVRRLARAGAFSRASLHSARAGAFSILAGRRSPLNGLDSLHATT